MGNLQCPICNTNNDDTVYYCVNCGQMLRAVELSDKEYKNYFDKKVVKSGGIFKFIILLIAVASIFYSLYKESLVPIVNLIIPPKIVSISSINKTINQNEKCDLPTKVAANMNYGKNKAVDITWTPENIDPSTPGTKTAIGKVSGYDGTINFTLSVLPHRIITQVKDCTVENSLIELNIKVLKNVKRVWFKICKDDKKKDKISYADNGSIKDKIYLPFGSGEYEITVLTSDNMDGSMFYVRDSFNVVNKDTRDMSFLLPEDYVESDSPEIIELANNIVFGLDTEYEKTLAIHDWVASNIAYDTEAYFNNNVHTYSALETVRGKKAVCNGYANLTAALNRSVGIRTKIVSGTAWTNKDILSKKTENHAWNETLIDGKWLIQDTTWDSGGIQPGTKKFIHQLSHEYFNPSPSKFEKSHQKISEKE